MFLPERGTCDTQPQGDPTEQIQLLAQDLKRQSVRFIVPCDEVDHGDIPLLAVPMATPDALFDSLWVPRQVVVDDGLAELKVQPFCAGLRAHQDLRTRAEFVHERKSHGDLATGLRRLAENGRLLPVAIGRAPASHVRDHSRRETR